MTVRLTIALPAPRYVAEYATFGEAFDAAQDAYAAGGADLLLLQHLRPPHDTVWAAASEGDEVVAPDNSCWRVERALDGAITTAVDGTVKLVSLDGAHTLEFPVTGDMPIRLRAGVLTECAQLLADVGLTR